MKDYAERTGSRLEIKERGAELYVTLQNDMGFVLTEDRGLGAAILMADYAVVGEKRGRVL